jgi:hypothetical protein
MALPAFMVGWDRHGQVSSIFGFLPEGWLVKACHEDGNGNARTIVCKDSVSLAGEE